MTIIASLLAALNLAAAPAPPKSLLMDDVRDWVAANILPMGYFPFDNEYVGVSYLALSPEQDLRAPVVRAWVRREYFEPQTLSGRLVQSERRLLDLDCAGGRTQARVLERYQGLNLQGAAETTSLYGDWTTPEPGTAAYRQMALLCEAKAKGLADSSHQASTAPPSLAGQPSSSPRTDAEVEAWIAANIETERAYWFEYQREGVVFLYLLGRPVAAEPARMDIRHEYFRPMTIAGKRALSDYIETEIDCRSGRIRALKLEVYEAQNNKGDLTVFDNPLAWTVPAADTEQGREVALICREMREPGYALGVQKGPNARREQQPNAAVGRVVPRRR